MIQAHIEGETQLHRDARHGNVAGIEAAIDRDRRAIYARTEVGLLPQHYAAIGGRPQAISNLLDAGADVDARDSGDATMLYYAAVYTADPGDARDVDLLISRGADVNARMVRGITPLMRAAIVGNLTGVKALLRCKKVDVNACDDTDKTALDHAEIWEMDGIIEALKKAGAVNGPYHQREQEWEDSDYC